MFVYDNEGYRKDLVALAAVRSKAMVLLLLIRCWLLLLLLDSVIVLCFVVRYLASILFCNHLDEEERAGFFVLVVFLVSHDCCVALTHDAMGLSAVCDCGISWSYSLTIFGVNGQGQLCLNYCPTASNANSSFIYGM